MANKKVESVIHADGVDIAVVTTVGKEEDYISLTDMARHKNPIAPKDEVGSSNLPSSSNINRLNRLI